VGKQGAVIRTLHNFSTSVITSVKRIASKKQKFLKISAKKL
jgi:hypothetical protein